MPSALAMTRSSGVVMNPRTRSAFAPTYIVETWMIAMSLRGYCRTLSARIDCRPAIRMTRLTTTARTGRLTNRSVSRISVVLRLRSRLVTGLNLVVDYNRSTVAKLENAGGHNLCRRLKTRDNRNLIATRRADFHKLLAHTAIGLAFRILHLFDHVDGISVWRIADGRSGQGHGSLAGTQLNFRLDEH